MSSQIEFGFSDGFPISQGEASELLGCGRAWVSQLSRRGALERVVVDGRAYVGRGSVLSYPERKRRVGRPRKGVVC